MTDRKAYSFIGCESSYEQSKIVIFGAPFDGTTTYRPGARFGPSTIRNESYGIETFSPYQDKDMLDISVFDWGDLEFCFGNTKRVIDDIHEFTGKIISDGKIPCMLGGEHLITLPAVEAALKAYPGLRLIHFDAHADLRDDYLGEKLSHSTVIRRCYDLLGCGKIYQFGIRSGEKEEFEFAKKETFLRRFDFSGAESLTDSIKDYPVYLTIDLDVLDSSVFPGTGTPEAGGVSFTGLLSAIKAVSHLNIVAMDMCELSPAHDLSGASTALACKLLRELLLYTYKN